MKESNDFQSGKSIDKLIDDLERSTEKYGAESEKFFRGIYENAVQTDPIDNAGCSIAKKCDLPKLTNRDACERLIFQYLERLKQLNSKLNCLSVSEQILLFLDHLEIYKQKTIDFCRSTLKTFPIDKLKDHSKEFDQIIELFRYLKTKLDEVQDSGGSDGIGDFWRDPTGNIKSLFDRHFKHYELDAIDFDQLIEATAKCVQSETETKSETEDRKASAKKEIAFKLNLITEKARISLKTFEDELLKNQNDELSAFVEKTFKTISEMEGSLRFDLQPVDNEDVQFNSFLKAISSSVQSFVSKVRNSIGETVEKSFYEQRELNEELIANLGKLAGSVLIKKLAQDRHPDVPKDLKVDPKKLNTHQRSVSFTKNQLQRKLENLKKSQKEPYAKESDQNDLMFKTADLIAVAKKHRQNAVTDEEANSGLLKIKVSKGKKINVPSIYKIISTPSAIKEPLSKLTVSPKRSTSPALEKKAPSCLPADNTKKLDNLESAKKKIQKMFKPDKKGKDRKDSGKKKEKKAK